MASPQKENGYISIANELWIALIHIELKEYERKYLMTLLAKTYGFNKKEDWVSNSQFCDMTGIKKSHISRTEKDLCDRKIVLKVGLKKSINKDYEAWLGKNKVTSLGNSIKQKVTSLGYKVTSLGNKSYPIRGTQKTQDNIQKTVTEQSSALKNKKMKNNSFRYNESNTSDFFEDVVDADSGEVVKDKRTNATKSYREMLAWGENRRGAKFINITKQFKAFSVAKGAGVGPDRLRERWCEFETDNFWSKKGFDWLDVVNSFDKRQ